MKREIIAFARCANCGGRAFRSSGRLSTGFAGSASRRSCWSRCARATVPMPKAERESSQRREGRQGVLGSVDIEELVGAEKLLAKIGHGVPLGLLGSAGCPLRILLFPEEAQ